MNHEMVGRTVVFFRKDTFYPILLLSPRECGKSLEEQAEEHAEINPGTERVETLQGKVLWRKQ